MKSLHLAAQIKLHQTVLNNMKNQYKYSKTMKSHHDKPAVRFTISISNFPILIVAVSKCFDFSGFDLITPILKVRNPTCTLQD